MSRHTTAQRRIGRAFGQLLRDPELIDPASLVAPCWRFSPKGANAVAALRSAAVDAGVVSRVRADQQVLVRASRGALAGTWVEATVLESVGRRARLRVDAVHALHARIRVDGTTAIVAVRELRARPSWWR